MWIKLPIKIKDNKKLWSRFRHEIKTHFDRWIMRTENMIIIGNLALNKKKWLRTTEAQNLPTSVIYHNWSKSWLYRYTMQQNFIYQVVSRDFKFLINPLSQITVKFSVMKCWFGSPIFESQWGFIIISIESY